MIDVRPITMHRLLAALFAVALLWATPAPADDAEVPEKYMSVDQVKGLLDQKRRVVFVDVRPKEQFDDPHIRGARSVPLRDLTACLADLPRQDLLVLY